MPSIPTPLPPSLWSDGARRVAAVVAMLAVAGIGFGAGYLVFDREDGAGAPPPTTVAFPSEGDDESSAAAFAVGGTRNTTRFAGTDPAATAAAIVTATHPSDADRPTAVTLAPADSWQIALAASPLVADPVGAPILLSTAEDLPDSTASTIEGLRPAGISSDDGTKVIAVGRVASDDDLETRQIEGDDPAEIASMVDESKAEISGDKHPDHIIVVSSEEPGYAMPAAAWAAYSGDSILFTGSEELPDATVEAIERHPNTPVYLLGPEAAISASVAKELRKVSDSFTRIAGDEPAENAIAFARFTDGTFGWGITDPGHGFSIASVEEPIDAPIAAPLAVSGKPGPLLVTTDSQAVPAALQSFLADTQPGYVDDPTRAIYNHIWIIGGPAVISETFQGQVDVLTNLVAIDTTPDVGSDPGERREAAGSDRPGGGRD